jgi:hypothetical protein
MIGHTPYIRYAKLILTIYDMSNDTAAAAATAAVIFISKR